MSPYLLDATITYLRGCFSAAEVRDLQPYGGEFNSAESDALSYSCPAMLVTVFGWAPEPNPVRLTGRNVRAVRMGAFIAYKHAERQRRMAGAMALADKLAFVLQDWTPEPGSAPVRIAPLDAEPTCENLYGRAMDKRGQALWLVTWEQCIKPLVPLPQLYDLLSVEIVDTTRQGVVAPQAASGDTVPVVTEQVDFSLLPPPA